MKTVTVQNTPCIRQDSESELKKVRMSRNDGIAILIPIYNCGYGFRTSHKRI